MGNCFLAVSRRMIAGRGCEGITTADCGQGHKVGRLSETFAFDKGVEPKLLGIALNGPKSIELGEW